MLFRIGADMLKQEISVPLRY